MLKLQKKSKAVYVHKGEKNYLNQIFKEKNHEYNQFIYQ